MLPFDCRYCEAYRSWADIDVTLALGKGKAPGEVGVFNEIQLSKKSRRQLKEGRKNKKTAPKANMQVESLQVKRLTVQVFNRSVEGPLKLDNKYSSKHPTISLACLGPKKLPPTF